MLSKIEQDLYCSLRAMLMYEDVPRPQRKALALYTAGLSNINAARTLGVSVGSYAWCLRAIRKRFKLKTRAELVVLHAAMSRKTK